MEKQVLKYREWSPFQKMAVLVGFTLTLVLVAFLSAPTDEVLAGLWRVLTYNNVLLTDYLYVGNLGGSFLNSGLLLLMCTFLLWLNKAPFNGLSFGAVFIVLGLSFLGKNLINVIPIITGTYLYAKYKGEPFLVYLHTAFFATAMSPIVTEVMNHIGFSLVYGIAAGTLIGLFFGFITPMMAAQFLKVGEGNNLYNVGFTAGILFTMTSSLFMAFGYEHTPNSLINNNYHYFLMWYIYVVCACFIVIGLVTDRHALRYFRRIMQRPGTLLTDFVVLDGFSASLVNMGISGIIAVTYVVVVGGDFNGATISSIFSLIGFAAAGKHPKNSLPIMVGVAVGSFLMADHITLIGLSPQAIVISETTPVMAAIFGSALAPIGGKFGFLSGAAAGFIHLAFVYRAAGLHAGLNLYNHGFSAGMVAMVMTPFLNAFVKPVKLSDQLQDQYIEMN